MSTSAKFFTKGELESVCGYLASSVSCHIPGGGSLEPEEIVSAWKAGSANYVADHLRCFPNDKREDIECEKEVFGDCVKTLEKIQRAHEQPDGLTFIYTIDPATVGKMRETAKLLNIPFKAFARIHADVSFVFTCATEDLSLTIGHYVWPSRAAAQKAANRIIAAGRRAPGAIFNYMEDGEETWGTFSAEPAEAAK